MVPWCNGSHLEVAVGHAAGVEVGHAAQQLPAYAAELGNGEGRGLVVSRHCEHLKRGIIRRRRENENRREEEEEEEEDNNAKKCLTLMSLLLGLVWRCVLCSRG